MFRAGDKIIIYHSNFELKAFSALPNLEIQTCRIKLNKFYFKISGTDCVQRRRPGSFPERVGGTEGGSVSLDQEEL